MTFMVLLITAGIRATPALLMVPLEEEFGWSRAAISARRRDQHRAVRSDRTVRRVGDGSLGAAPRSSPARRAARRVRGADHADAAPVADDAAVGRAASAPAPASPRWCSPRSSPRAGSTSGAGWCSARSRRRTPPGSWCSCRCWPALVEQPRLAAGRAGGGRRGRGRLRRSSLIFMRDRPRGSRPAAVRRKPDDASRTPGSALSPFAALSLASRSRAFWVLAGTFFVCGASTNGLIGTHLIRRLSRLRHSRGALGAAARGDGHLRHPRHDGVGLAHRSLFEPAPAVRATTRCAGCRCCFCRSRWRTVPAASGCSRCSTGSTGLRPCRRPFA